MKDYIATFYSHFGALTFFNNLKKQNITAKLMPVPRKLSSSCGTCVSFSSDMATDFENEDLEAIYLFENQSYIIIKK